MTVLHYIHSSTIESTKVNNRQPIESWNVPLIIKACPDIDSTRICDPDHILKNEITNTNSSSISYDDEIEDDTETRTDRHNATTSKEQEQEEDSSGITSISAALYELETRNYPLLCQDDTTRTSDGPSVQMAVVVVREMELSGNHYLVDDQDYKINHAKMVATALHDRWGVGSTDCGGSGILLFLSVNDRVVYISIGSGLVSTLTSNRIDGIIENMKPFLRNDEYSHAIVNSIFAIIRYLDQGPPSFLEKNYGFVIFGTIVLIMWGVDKWNKKKKREYVRIKSHLEKMDRERAMALMGKFECTSCPICLEDFQKAQPDSSTNKQDDNMNNAILNDEPYLGSDGKTLQLLKCGHSFDKTCWDHWVSKNSKTIHQCPICKQDIGGGNGSGSGVHVDNHIRPIQQDIATRQDENNYTVYSEERPLVSFLGLTNNQQNHSLYTRSRFTTQQQRNMYEMERQFRIHRLRHRYPYYIRQTHVDRWTRNDYDGNMAQDGDFVNQDPNLVREWKSSNASSTAHSHGHHSFGSFGGGQSGGGGGGTW